jgi:hypothetical protein
MKLSNIKLKFAYLTQLSEAGTYITAMPEVLVAFG